MFPQFDQRTPEGFPAQQDAEECFTLLFNTFKNHLKTDAVKDEDLVDRLLAGELTSVYIHSSDLNVKSNVL
jgi:hypothetical protein